MNKEKQLLRKSIPCFSIFKLFLYFFTLLISQSGFSQIYQEQRLQVLENQLQSLANTSVSGLNETANLSVANAPIQDFLRGLASTHALNINIEAGLNIKITNNFTNVKVLNLLLFLAREYQLDIQITGNILSFYKYTAPAVYKPPVPGKRLRMNYETASNLFTADLLNDSLTTFAKQVTQLTKKNLILAPGLRERFLSAYVETMPLEAALDKIAFANNLRFLKTKDGAFLFQSLENVSTGSAPSSNNYTQPGRLSGNTSASAGNTSGGSLSIDVNAGEDGKSLIDIDAVNIPIVDLINQVSNRAGINYVMFSPVPGNTTAQVSRISYEDFLRFLLKGTTHTFKQLDGIYSIGERNLEGFRTTKVIRMQYRPVDKLDEVIPVELKKGVEIKVFAELNSIIFSGSSPQIQEISEFLKAIDEPVKNVLIEVMVVEMRRGRTIKTGINAGLSDSLVRTKGQIFPEVDMTFGSRSINDFLEKLSAKGLVNLGRVAPNFYVTLQALENNNYLDIKSTPKLSTLNGHEAKLLIGQSVYYLEQNQVITGGVTPITSVTQQFKQVTADLNIKILPMISGDEHITLNVDAEFSDFIPPTIQGAPPGNATRKFTSMIRIRNEEMIVLGGLEEVSKSKSGSGVPILSRIPILKWIFSSKSDEKRNNKLIVFIKPTLLY